jgi:SRSO17 transposase
MLERALDAGVPATWVTADEVYGGSPALREWLEERRTPCVLAVKCTELLAVQAPDGPAGARASAEQLAAGVPAEQWIACSAGYGAKGRRLYDWTRIEPASPATSGWPGGWAVEEGFQQAKGEVGLDHYEVRRWPGWYRHTTLALLAHAFLAVTRAQASCPQRAKGGTAA